MLEYPSGGQSVESVKWRSTVPLKSYLWKVKGLHIDLLKTLQVVFISSQSLQSWDMLRTLLSRQEETQRLTGQMPCGERGKAWSRGVYTCSWSWDWRDLQAKEHQALLMATRSSESWATGSAGLPGRSRGLLTGVFMFSWLLPTQPLVKTPALCLPAHQVQATDNNSKRYFSKVSTPPPKPGLDLLSSILNRLQAQFDPGAIQNTWLMSLHYLGLSWVIKIQ